MVVGLFECLVRDGGCWNISLVLMFLLGWLIGVDRGT